MPLFFFDLDACGTVTEDHVGHECADLAAAERHAIGIARGVMAKELARGELCLSCQIDIFDDKRRKVLEVPFRRAVIVTGL